MPDEITLDRSTFKALAADSRVSILKSLLKRRKTGAELSEEFSLSASTIKEHLDNLAKAGLVRLAEDAPVHKWKYYELTDKGRKIVEPAKAPAQFWVVLLVAVLAVAVAFQVFQPIALQSNAPALSSPEGGLSPLADLGQAAPGGQAAPARDSSQPPAPTLAPFAAESAKTAIANPAATYCIQQGFRLEYNESEQGTMGFCVSPSNQSCEEWAYFRGECSFK